AAAGFAKRNGDEVSRLTCATKLSLIFVGFEFISVDLQLFGDVDTKFWRRFDSFYARLSPGVDSRTNRSRRATAARKIDKVSGRLAAQDRIGSMTGIGIDVGPECIQNVDGV